MTDVELVIKISEKVYNALTHIEFDANLVTDEMRKSIANGTPLPKGHGRLIDADKLVPDCQEDFVYYDDDEYNVFTAIGIAQIECADTVIEADRIESDDKA